MSGSNKNLVLALAVAAAVASPAAFATTGYFAHGYSMKEKGLAGAGTAFAQDSLAAATNPAGMVMVGNRLDVGVSLFSPQREYTATGSAGVPDGTPCGALCPFEIGPQTIESENDYFLIPQFGYNHMLDADSSIGVSVYGNGGMNTEYKGGTAQHNDGLGNAVTTDGTFGAGTAGVDLSQLFVAVTYARKITPTSSWGVTPILAYQRFKAMGLGTFAGFSSDQDNLSDNGYDDAYGFGVKVGVQGEVAPGITLGASYQSEMAMSEFDKYKGLFAEQGDFDIPATANVGLAWKATPTSMLAFDIQKIWYSKVNSIGNPLTPNIQTAFLGDSDGAGFGWDDIMIYKLGYQWQMGTGMTWRVGYSYNEQPIPNSEVLFNILAPGVQQHHFTFGLTADMGNKQELTFAAMYSPEEKISGENPFDPAQTIELRMEQYEIGVAYSWKF